MIQISLVMNDGTTQFSLFHLKNKFFFFFHLQKWEKLICT